MATVTYYYPSSYGAATFDPGGGVGQNPFPAGALQNPDGYTSVRVDSADPSTAYIITGYDSATVAPTQYVVHAVYSDADHVETVNAQNTIDFFLQNAPYANTGYTFSGPNIQFVQDPTLVAPPTPVSPTEQFAHSYELSANANATGFTVGAHDYGGQTIQDYHDPGASTDNLAQLGDVTTNGGDHFSVINGAGYLSTPVYKGQTAHGGVVGYNAYAHQYYLYTNDTYQANTPLTVSKAPFTIVCFATGTLIRTVRGDVAVEALTVDDLAITAAGEARPIRWIGHRTIDCRAHAQPRDVWPIRVAAHAFGDGLPAADLFLSAGHSVRVGVIDDVLIPIGRLINGATIARHPVDTVTYWHVELDSHDVLVANGLPAESFLDCGNRAGLLEQEGTYDRSEGPHTPADFCLPFVDDGETLDAIRALLAARASRLGWTTTRDMDMHLVVDGVRVEPDIDGEIARFFFSAAAKNVVLASLTRTPADMEPVVDDRRLGVSLHRIEIGDGLGLCHDLVAADGRLADLVHAENDARGHHRFTNGRLALPPALWSDCRGQVVLRVHHDPQAGTRWVIPTPRVGDNPAHRVLV